jgi:hypothetical protein
VKGREEGGGSGGKGVEEGAREWWGGSGDAGPSLPFVVAFGGAGPPLLFVVGACGPSLPFVFGARCCHSLLARVVAVFRWRAPLLFVIGARRCLGWYCGGVVVRGGSSGSVGGRCVPCTIIIRGWGIVVVRGWGIVVCGWGSLLSVGGRCGHGWGIVVVRGRSSFGWWVVVEQGGRRLRARSPSIGGGGVSSVVCRRYLLVTEFQRLGLGGRAHQWTTNEICRSSSGCHVADGDVAPGMWVSKGRGERGKPTYFGW